MKARTSALLAAAAILAGLGAFLVSRRVDPIEPPPPPPAPKPGGAAVDVSTEPAADARVFRSRDEVILLARRPSDGLPLSRARVALLDAEVAEVGRGQTDSRGFWRGPCPPGARSVAIAAEWELGQVMELPLPDPPAAPAPGPPIFADRAVLRPGDAMRVLAWFRAGQAVPTSGTLAVDGEPVPLQAVDTIPGSGWRLFRARVPGDVRPGTATVEIGDARLAVPVAPRWAAAAETTPAAGPAVPTVGDPALSCADGGWRVALAPPADGHAVLVFAVTDGWFLDHGVSIAEGSEAFVPLWPEEPAAAVEIVAVVAAPDGFRVHRAAAGADAKAITFEPVEKPPVPHGRALRVVAGEHAVPMAAAVSGAVPGGNEPILVHEDSATSLLLPLDAFHGRDAVVRAIAIPPGRAPVEAAARVLAPEPAPEAPAWIYEGDEPADPAPASKTGAFPLIVRVFAPAGVPTEFPSDPPAPPDLQLFWIPMAGPGSGSVRISAGLVLVSEGTFGGSVTGGLFPARHLEDGALVAVSDAAGFRGVALLAMIPVAPDSVRASDSRDLAVTTRLPTGAAVGSEFEARVSLRAAATPNGSVEVTLPLPRGVLPAEDGWALRARSPAGTRVTVAGTEIRWALPSLPAGETTLTVRLRAAFRGRWGAPPATASTSDPSGPHVHGAGSTLVIE